MRLSYAMEGQSNVKEQLNKRKPDEEYAHINMSYINVEGEKWLCIVPKVNFFRGKRRIQETEAELVLIKETDDELQL